MPPATRLKVEPLAPDDASSNDAKVSVIGQISGLSLAPPLTMLLHPVP